MRILIKKIINQNNDIITNIISRLITLFGSLTVASLVSFKLDPSMQGAFYSFMSIAGITSIFELGFNNIIVQYISHNRKDLVYVNSFLKLVRNYNIYTVIILFVTLNLIGFYFFNDSQYLYYSWVLFTLSSSCYFIFLSRIGVLEGLNKTILASRYRLLYSSINLISIILLLSNTNFNLWCLGISQLVALFFCIKIFKLNIDKQHHELSYFKEIWPLQKKYIITWISGYFIINAIVPITYTYSPLYAGKIGLSLSIVGSISAIIMAGFNTRIPLLCNTLAEGNILKYNNTFKKFSFIAISFSILSGVLLYVFLYLGIFDKLGIINQSSLVPLGDFTYLILFIILQVIVYLLSTYLRNFKKEPFAIHAFITAVTMIVLLLYSLNDGIVSNLGRLIFINTFFISFPIAILIFKKFKKIYVKEIINNNSNTWE